MLDWTGKTAIIAASGPSLTLQQCKAAEASGLPIIAVNATYRLLPSAIVYIGDMLAVKHYGPQIPRSRERVWTVDANAAFRYGLNHVRGRPHEGLCTKPGTINTNGNGGFSAINLAFQFGARRLLLIGFDMQLGESGERHWHEDHPQPMVQNQCFAEWIHKSAKLARDLEREGCAVVNCTPGSALHCWPMGDFETELAR